jgi:non-ribosomal peptide synthetase component F
MTAISLRDPATPAETSTGETSREFWRGVLLAGGVSSVPKWTLDPRPGAAEHEETLPADLVATLRRRAAELAVPLASVLLAAHAQVLAALSGELEVVTGYLTGNGQPLPCRLMAGPGSWRALLRRAQQAESQLLAHGGYPVGDLRRELGLTGPPFETAVDLTGGAGSGALTDGVAVRVAVLPHRTGSCCGCGTAPTCSTPTPRRGSRATTSPRSG